uniref:ABC transporter domain-containing protein n=1 Tax=viral metagenome TaxID=1070528 RepID=A0A6C0AXP9_9ZZZZ|tara:strand:- start:326 stop:2038 length:1713 start_codon:yes stop_codon:yes gene_type:complete
MKNDNFYKTVNLLYIDFIKIHWKTIIALLIVNMILFPTIQIIQPKILTAVFENLSKITSKTELFNFSENYNNKTPVYFLYLYVSIWILIIIAHTIKNGIDLYLSPELHGYTRHVIHNKILERYKNDYKDIKIGNITTLMHSINRITLYVWNFISQEYLPNTLSMIIVMFYFLYHDLQIFLFLAFSLVLSFIGYILAFDIYNDQNAIREKNVRIIWNKLGDDVNNLMNIYINNRVKKEKDTFINLNNNEVKINTDMKIYENITAHLNQLVMFSMYIAVYFRLFHLLKLKKKSLSFAISSFIILNGILYNQLEIVWKVQTHFFWFLSTINYYSDSIGDILFNNNENNIKNNIKNGKIVFDNICFKYNKNDSKYLFKDFSFTINSNDKVAIVGRSGSGKTTLMKMIIDLHRPQKGNIYIDSVNVKNIDNEYLRNKVMYVNQRTLLFDKSVIYNIKYGNENISDDKVIKLIQKYNLQPIYKELQNGLQSSCGVNGNNLSLGMQKTTIILRAILNECKIIIMDEPLAGLDQQSRTKIIKLIMSECNNRTLIVITHDKEILPHMNKKINLQNLKNN